MPAQHRSLFSCWVSWRVFAPVLLPEPEAESEVLTFDSFKYHFLICNKNTDILTLKLAGSTCMVGYEPSYVESWENRLLSTTTWLLSSCQWQIILQNLAMLFLNHSLPKFICATGPSWRQRSSVKLHTIIKWTRFPNLRMSINFLISKNVNLHKPSKDSLWKRHRPGTRKPVPGPGPTQVLPLPEHYSDMSIPHQPILS